MSNAWSWYVIALVALNIVGCVWLLWWTGKRRPGDPAPTDTSHVWDGDLTEYNKPMPRWWINLFYLTIVFGIGYLVYYPGLGAFAGTSRWTSAKAHASDKAAQDKKLAAAFARFDGQPIDVLARDPAARQLGKAIFANHCATCHGSAAQGAKGYPNLTDDIWHWGGQPQQILATVLDGREGVMTPWEQALGGMPGVTETAVYVQSLSGHKVDTGLARAGQGRFAGICAACHGADGKGNPGLGAPDLSDDYWLYGGDFNTIRESIAKGRHGVMPAHRELLGETRARVVAGYVYSLSHGQPAAGAE
jgi:cytochrome c oxidase cbb3-type subunit 3